MKIIAEPIDVIAKFIVKEKPTPIKFRYVNDAGKVIEMKVDQVIEIEEIREVGYRTYIFHCQSKVSGVDKRFELKLIAKIVKANIVPSLKPLYLKHIELLVYWS